MSLDLGIEGQPPLLPLATLYPRTRHREADAPWPGLGNLSFSRRGHRPREAGQKQKVGTPTSIPVRQNNLLPLRDPASPSSPRCLLAVVSNEAHLQAPHVVVRTRRYVVWPAPVSLPSSKLQLQTIHPCRGTGIWHLANDTWPPIGTRLAATSTAQACSPSISSRKPFAKLYIPSTAPLINPRNGLRSSQGAVGRGRGPRWHSPELERFPQLAHGPSPSNCRCCCPRLTLSRKPPDWSSPSAPCTRRSRRSPTAPSCRLSPSPANSPAALSSTHSGEPVHTRSRCSSC